MARKEIVEVYINEINEPVHIHVNGEEIFCTPTHPFYSPVKGWTSAVHLRAGDILVLVNGEYVVVEWVQHELLESPIKVYNFQVADYHTYYVSGAGVLVHNKCPSDFRYSDDQQAVIDLAKESKRGLSKSEAETLWEFSQEYGIRGHGVQVDSWLGGLPHIKVHGIHIPIIGG